MSSLSTLGPAIIDVDGLSLTSKEELLIQRPAVGGIIFFARNYESVEQLEALVQSIRAIRPGLLIAVDQEGGRVQRFKQGFTRLPPLAALGELMQSDIVAAKALAKETGWLMASELLAVGIDFSFAPVVDLDRGVSQVIGDRSFGDKAETVTGLAGEMIAGMHEAGMRTTLKHFPGHGFIDVDSHVAIPVDERDFELIAADDLKPFQALAANTDAVMPAHVIYPKCDENPAGFSSFWLKSVLRKQLGFSGVIFSDDLTMEGASVAGGFAARAEQALTAGCDMVLICNHREGAVEALDWLESQQMTLCNKAQSMRAARYLKRDELVQNPRWKKVQSQVQNLVSQYSANK